MRIVLVHPNYHSGDAEVRTLSCCAAGAAACRFRIDLPHTPGIPAHA